MDRLGLGDGKADRIAHRAVHRLSGNPCVLDLENAGNEGIIENYNGKFKNYTNPLNPSIPKLSIFHSQLN